MEFLASLRRMYTVFHMYNLYMESLKRSLTSLRRYTLSNLCITCKWNPSVASHADVLRSSSRDEPLRTSAWEANPSAEGYDF